MKLVQKTFRSTAIVTTAVLGISIHAEAANLTVNVGLNFTGSTLGIDSGFIPPDTMGGVGNDHIVELINGRYSVYDKTTGTRVQTSTLDTFWTDAGVTFREFTFDPRVLYDQNSKRWFAVAVDNARNANNFLVAVSNSSDPTLGWNGFAIDSDSDDSHWADFGTLGLNADGVFIAANMFPLVGSGVNTTILTLPKTDLISGSVANRNLFENINPNTTGFTLQPVVDLDNTGQPHPLFSAFNTGAGFFKRSTINGLINSPTIDTTGGFIRVPPFSLPLDAEQPGLKEKIDTGDNRISSNLVLKDGSIWGVQSVNNNDRSALRWFEIDEATNTLLQEGLIADPELAFYYGSIAVNDSKQVAIGFSGSSENQFVSSYVAIGETIGGTTTFENPLLLKAGVDDYQVGFSRNRWGDYSATVVDPDDPSTFWTFQEWVSGDNQWSTQITQLNITKPTSVPEPVSVLGLLGFGALSTLKTLKRKHNKHG
ncbi:MAG: hypothetical protein F6K18_08540 [Okeania sp. SIO2C2]|uniref:hypothetical protein n=1 Tax=Okeania sp. SIO2C2 TaxID=2607787 RepID=UPI0013BC200D|nr:hypothetical protein [Okeania sp. SIO2C2]NEP86877.1 hypothetical protein [Okeania sp. SIO2C2]